MAGANHTSPTLPASETGPLEVPVKENGHLPPDHLAINTNSSNSLKEKVLKSSAGRSPPVWVFSSVGRPWPQRDTVRNVKPKTGGSDVSGGSGAGGGLKSVVESSSSSVGAAAQDEERREDRLGCSSSSSDNAVGGGVTIVVPQLPQLNGGQEENKGSSVICSSSSDKLPRRSVGHKRESSNSSNRSGVLGCDSSSTSSSSSLSHETSSLSHDSSFMSRSMLLEQLKSELAQQHTYSDPTLGSTTSSSPSPQAPSDKEIIQQLLENIISLKMEVTTLKEENTKLTKMRTHMDDELHELTENLFEEAYKMVDEAKGGKVVAEKRLADAAGKIDAMETEVSALKNLLHNPVPSEGDSLHPPHHHHKHKKSGLKKAIRKISKRTGIGSQKASSSKHHMHTGGAVALVEHKSEVVTGAVLIEGEPIQEDYEEFEQWLQGLSSDKTHPYLNKIIATDLNPCLSFRNTELSEQLLHAVEENNLLMESLTNGSDEKRECALSRGGEVTCTHRIKMGDSEHWHYISQQCRDRIAAACDFYMYVGHIQKGILKRDDPIKLYWQVARLRAMMTLARLTLSLPEDRLAH